MRGVRASLIVTGTDTGVGKTIVTAAIAAAASAAGLAVAVVKPCQTGIDPEADDLTAGDEPDADVVARLAAPAFATTLETYAAPLAPAVAARLARRPALALDTVIDTVRTLQGVHDLVVIEGAGGVLVPMGDQAWTVIDLAMALSAPAVIVARSGLGTLNHTALTRMALASRGVRDLVVLGSWPKAPALVDRTNLRELPAIAGAVPEGAGTLPGDEFRAQAPQWLAPELHGSLNTEAFTVMMRR